METIFLISLSLALLASLVLPWINRSHIRQLSRQVEHLQHELRQLRAAPNALVGAEPVAATSIGSGEHEAHVLEFESILEPEKSAGRWEAEPEPLPAAAYATASARSFEQRFGGQASVWLGGVALALAGFFMVKYSIESGLVTPQVRVLLGTVFGLVLLYAGDVVRKRPGIANGRRISQALTGAAIADFYGCLFAATTLYQLIPSWLGFAGLAMVTVVALAMSLRHGAPIAMLGLIGGYATPLMVQGEPNTPLLLGYLYFVFTALLLVIRREGWWWLSIPATLVALLWVGFCVLSGMAATDGKWLSLFLLGTSLTAVLVARGKHGDGGAAAIGFRYTALCGALLMAAFLTHQAGFSSFEWGMLAILSAAAVTLAWFDHRSYGFAPWLAMAANAAMLATWQLHDSGILAAVIAGFGLAFSSSAYLLMHRSRHATSWAGISVTSALTYYLLAYYKLNSGLVTPESEDTLWAVIAFVLAATFTWTAARPFVRGSEVGERQRLQSVFAVAVTAFLSTGFAILLDREFLAFAVAAEILTVSWLGTRTAIPILRHLAHILAAIFVMLLIPELIMLLGGPLDDFSTKWITLPANVVAIPFLLVQIGMPALFFAAASVLLRRERDDLFVGLLEFAAITLFGLVSYGLIAGSLAGEETALIARGIFSIALLLLGFGALRIGRMYSRPAVQWGGLMLVGVAAARIAGFDLLLLNPLWSHQFIGEWPLLNGLLPLYGLPALLILLLKDELFVFAKPKLAMAGKIAACILVFVFITLNIRAFYHGAYLDGGVVTNPEVYTYSVVWLMLGIAALFAGTMRGDRMLRIASLLIMLLTIGKVFVYDVAELTGLWRVLSFLGLGLCLLGLSWFYSRFVLGAKAQTADANQR